MEIAVGAGILLTAGALGITHGIEPDHVAGISALTHEAGDPKLSALVGACFAAGHALLVVLWILLAYGLFGMTTFRADFEQVGLLFVGGVLSLLGIYLGLTGTRKLLHEHHHEHGDTPHSHYHLHLPSWLRPSSSDHDADRGDHAHSHGVVEYLEIGTVGALFTLSPPVSMIAFISVTMSKFGAAQIVGIVAVYSVAIIATMAIIGGGAGSLFRLLRAKGEHVHAVSQILASLLVLGFAMTVLFEALPAGLG